VKLIKKRIYRYLTLHGTKKYIDKLQDLTRGLNDRYIKSLQMAPSKVTMYNAEQIFNRKLEKLKQLKNKVARFKVGDRCRILIKKDQILAKFFTPNFSEEIFIIASIKKRIPAIVYQLTDLTGQKIEGEYYAAQLSIVE
jgi:hypothetical protein